MSRCLHTRQAREDILDIWAYVAEENPDAADRLLDAIGERCGLLAASPGLGPARPDLAPGLRHNVLRSYLILYREIPDGVEIVRVLHCRRDVRAVFAPRE